MSRSRTPPPKKSDSTRARILDSALTLFRDNGFDGTTMRDIAAAAGLSLGAAYYYYPSKDAMVLAYYERAQVLHGERARAALAGVTNLRERLGIVMHTKLDVVRKERRLLGALVRTLGTPGDPLSVFSEASHAQREHAIALFREALSTETIEGPALDVLAGGLWLMHLALLLRLVHDDSPKQRRTTALVDGTLDLVVPLVAFSRLPAAQPIVERLAALLALAAA